MDINEYMRCHRSGIISLARRVSCADGFTMSVQASQYTYCTPRFDNAAHYSHVEIGFPSEQEPDIMEWAESPEDPTGSVYGWVPVEVVEAVIAKHGGYAEEG